MNNKTRKNKNNKNLWNLSVKHWDRRPAGTQGGKMLSLISVILIAGSVVCAQPMADYVPEDQEIGSLPEVVITAPRYEGEDIAYSGMLPEIIVTAPAGPEVGMLDEIVITEPRYPGEDIAYCGMLPEIVSTARRFDLAQPVLTIVRLVRNEMPMRTINLMLVTRIDARNTGYLY